MNPDLSIIIVSYNTRELTHACLRSVFDNIGGLSIDVILVDNNSADGSQAMVKECFPQVTLIENDTNRGFAAANNQGFELATGRHLLLLNSDTIVLGNVLEKSVEYLDKRSDVGAMGCKVLNTDRTMQVTCSGYPTLVRLLCMTLGLDRLLEGSIFDAYMLRHWRRDDERDVEVITGCYLVVRKQVLDQVGGLDERFFFFGEETDWCLRIRKAGWRLRFSPVGQIIHHGGGSVRKLNHKRDVMLTAAIVRLHQKNGGAIAGALAYTILMTFNLSRAVYWSTVALWRASVRGRAKHFRDVCTDAFAAWPRGQ